jgi:hypothetical protein
MKSKHFNITNPSPYPQKCVIPLDDVQWDDRPTSEPSVILFTDSSPLIIEECRVFESNFNIVEGISSGSGHEPNLKLPKIRISSYSTFTFEQAFTNIEKIFKEKLISNTDSAMLKTVASLVMEKTQPKWYPTFPDHLFFDDEKNTHPVNPMVMMSAYQMQSGIVDGEILFDIESCKKMTVVGIPPNSRHSIIIYIKQK